MDQISDSLLMLVDDELSTLQALERVFKNQFRVIAFQDPDVALQQLIAQFQTSEGPAIILADYSLPQQTGLSFLAEVRNRWPQTIRCLFSGQMNPLEISSALKSGVIHRFFQKPWDNENLRLHMIECLQLHYLLRQATSDDLTQLLNRKGLLEHLEIEIERSHRHQRPLTLMMLDLDEFKSINDIMGHQAGDQTVIEVAGVLKTTLRNIDLISRYGGDEFVVVLPDTDLNSASLVAERIRTKIEALSGKPEGFSVSIGLTLFGANHKSDIRPERISAATLIHQADTAMYQAKNLGKNKVRIYTPDRLA